jgi:hypothetical protein
VNRALRLVTRSRRKVLASVGLEDSIILIIRLAPRVAPTGLARPTA